MVRLGCAALIGGVFLMVFGGQELVTGLTNLKPTTLSYADYVEQKPKAKWLHLKGCPLNVIDASYRETNGQITELYVPVTPAEDKRAEEEGGVTATDDKTHVLVATSDPALIEVTRKMGGVRSEMDALTFIAENTDLLFPTRDVNGLVRFGMHLDSEDRKKLVGLDSDLADDFIIVDEGKRPSVPVAAAKLGGGGLLLAVGVGIFAAGRKKA